VALERHSEKPQYRALVVDGCIISGDHAPLSITEK
jgi:hypothetical protein